jgi:hypothetical protein
MALAAWLMEPQETTLASNSILPEPPKLFPLMVIQIDPRSCSLFDVPEALASDASEHI